MRGGGGEGIVFGIHARILKIMRLKENVTYIKKRFINCLHILNLLHFQFTTVFEQHDVKYYNFLKNYFNLAFLIERSFIGPAV